MGQELHDRDGGKKKLSLKLELTSTKTNPLLGRREVEFKVLNTASTPSRSQVRIQLAVTMKAELDQVYVIEIKTISGTQDTIGTAHVYDSPEQAQKVEREYILKRNKTAAPEASTAGGV